MSNTKKLIVAAVVWNIAVIIMLFLQTSIVISIIGSQLFPSLEFLKPLFDNNIVNFLTTRAITAGLLLASFIMAELVAFFWVNRFLNRRIVSSIESSEAESLKPIWSLANYYRFMNRYMLASIVVILGTTILYGVQIGSLASSIDAAEQHNAIIEIQETITRTEFKSLADITTAINTIVNDIKANNKIYHLVVKVLTAVDFISALKGFWFLLTYLLAFFGIYKGIRAYQVDTKAPIAPVTD